MSQSLRCSSGCARLIVSSSISRRTGGVHWRWMSCNARHHVCTCSQAHLVLVVVVVVVVAVDDVVGGAVVDAAAFAVFDVVDAFVGVVVAAVVVVVSLLC